MKRMLVFAGFAFLAFAVRAGDILEIRLSNELGEARLIGTSYIEDSPASDLSFPFYSGEDLYFKIRLVSREDNQQYETLSARSSFVLVHNPKSPQDEKTDWQEHPLEIGIVVSGETKWARLTRLQRACADPETGLLTRNCFDAVFTYHAEPGDLALPLLLARDEDGHAVDDGNRGYVFRNTNVWSICYCSRGGGTTNAVDFSFSDYPPRGGKVVIDDRYELDCLMANYSLYESGFNIKTVDFEDEWEGESCWKSVGEGLSKVCLLEALAPVPQDCRYFIWSENSKIARVKGGVFTEFALNKEATRLATNYVGEVVIPKGETLSKPFTLQGGTAGEAKLMLSCAKCYSYHLNDQQDADYLTVPISCVVREAIPVQVEAVAHTKTSFIVAETEGLAEGCVWSNHAAQVVHVCETGYRFPDGSTAVTNDLDTTANPATLRAGTVVPTCGQPSVCLGAVTQRYPWNGIVDVKYRATYWPADGQGAVAITLDGKVVTNALNIVGTGTVEGAAAIDLREIFPEARGEAKFKAVVK